jgi:hypothetical protein
MVVGDGGQRPRAGGPANGHRHAPGRALRTSRNSYSVTSSSSSHR